VIYKRLLPLFLLGRISMAAEGPVETQAMRKPTLVTHGNVLIKDARILTATHGIIEKGSILVQNGKIVAIGQIAPPTGVVVIDATGKVVAPGIVDAHVHRGIDSTNEGTDAITAETRIWDVLNPDNKNLWQALASGETTGMALHGSANPIGGQSVVIKFKFGHPVAELPISDAPRMIKFALGENVTRSGSTTATRFPHTRMGVQAVYRRAFTQAREYIKKWDAYETDRKINPSAKAPQRDLRLETLADILRGKIWVQCHSYRADEILMMVRLSQEFGFKIGAMQHAVEAYKVAPELAKAGIGASIFADSWAFKLEGYDSIPYGSSILSKGGVNVSVNTDGTGGTTAINLDAAKAMRFGGLTEEQALQLITINPARQLGVDHRVGSIEVGKDADLVIWDGHPLSIYSRVNTTLIEGEVMFQRRDLHGIDAASTLKTKLDPFKYVPNPTLPKLGKSYAIVGATVYPVSATPIQGGTVVIENGKITAVGKQVPIPPSAVKIDGKGMNVYPGFIDAGTTLGLTEFGQVGQASDAREFGTFGADLVALTAIQVQSAAIRTSLCQGITSALTWPRGGVVSGQASVINLSGFTNELMGIRPQSGLCVNWPGGGVGGFGGEDIDDCMLSDEDMLRGGQRQNPGPQVDASEISGYFDKALKYQASHDSLDPGLEAMGPYVKGQLPVFLRVRNASSIRAAVAFAKKYKLRAVLVGAPDAWREAKLLADSKIPVVIAPAGKSNLGGNPVVNDWDPYDTPYALGALLKRTGVQFCYMSDDDAMSMTLPERVGESCAYGLSPVDALRALTLSAAEILGVADQIGSLDPGKLGNLVITDGDPFEFTANVRYVFVNGQPVELTSRHTQLRDQYLKRVE
jgi:imidazolonepropionase-like amidohydrolase